MYVSKTSNYEVIIVGAGVSGLMLATLLDDSDIRVLLLERKTEIDIEPRTFGTFTDSVLEHKLEDYIEGYFDTFAFYGPFTRAAATEKNSMCLVNYHNWAQNINFKKITVKTDIEITTARRGQDGIILSDGHQEFHGRLVVDSSGYAQIVPKLLGLKTNKKTGLSYEVELDGCNFPHEKEASFILNKNVTNSGGWLYILANGKGQYGWADFYPESESTLADLRARTLTAMQSLAPQSDWLQGANISYSYGRFGPTGNITHLVEDGLMAIGDAGGSGTPVTLEGFREALDSAKFASITIKNSQNFSKSELELFKFLFHKKYGKYYRMHELVRYLYLHSARNQEIDRWVSNFNKMDKKSFFRLIRGELTPLLLLKTLDLALVLNILLNLINYVLPSFIRFRDKINLTNRNNKI
jgi:flavin-dependent dehydrogenase